MENNDLNKMILDRLESIENELKEMQVEISWLANKVETLSTQSIENIEEIADVKKSLEKTNIRLKTLEYGIG